MSAGRPSDDELRDSVDVVALQQLQSAYADIASRRAFDELPTVFRPDATVVFHLAASKTVSVQGPEALAAFFGPLTAQLDFFVFVILNHRIVLRHHGDPDAAVGRVYLHELRRESASERWNVAYGLYHDRYTRVDGRWWMAGREYHSLGRTNADIDVYPFPDVTFP